MQQLAILLAAAPSLLFGSFLSGGASAQSEFPSKPTATDPEAYDAINMFSRLCIATRGDRARAASILGSDDSTVERMNDATVNGLEGKPGGIGWTIRMPLGEKILVEFAADGACIVRAPRVQPMAIEAGLANLLDQISASGQFKVRKRGDDVRTIEKTKYHLMAYSVLMPDSGKTAEVEISTTENKVFIQGTITLAIPPDKP